MTSMNRPPTDLVLGNLARKALAAHRRFERRAAEATEQASLALEELKALHRKACERFGRDLPTDAFLLDLLELIEVADGDRWLWKGRRNNKNLATVRQVGGKENSVVRYLAVALGVIEEDEWGVLYPVDGDTEDVNPWHRVLRRSGLPIGNGTRFGFDLQEPTDA